MLTVNSKPLTPKTRRVPSTCTSEQLGQALAGLRHIEDPEKRAEAFMQTLTKLMISTVSDPHVLRDLIGARLEHAGRRRS